MDQILYKQMRNLEDRHWWFKGRRKIVQSVVSRLGLPRDVTILDAGCGTGGNFAMLSQFGDVTGAEYATGAVELARERGTATVIQARLPDQMPFGPGQFGLVTLLDVLEHIDDDEGSARVIARLLCPGGYLIVTVPAFPFLWSEHDTQHHHKRRYKALQLQRCLASAGLEISWMSYYNSLLFPVVSAVRLLRNLIPPRGSSARVGQDLIMPPAPINKLLETVFASERLWLGKVPVPFGVSLIAVACKK